MVHFGAGGGVSEDVSAAVWFELGTSGSFSKPLASYVLLVLQNYVVASGKEAGRGGARFGSVSRARHM
jgi:hypothetical protein